LKYILTVYFLCLFCEQNQTRVHTARTFTGNLLLYTVARIRSFGDMAFDITLQPVHKSFYREDVKEAHEAKVTPTPDGISPGMAADRVFLFLRNVVISLVISS
jgi:hypothetical protein